MAYAPHRPDLITFDLRPGGGLTLFRTISGLPWVREVPFNDWITPMEASVVLGVHRVTMYDWIAKGLVNQWRSEEGETWLHWEEIYHFGRAKGLLKQ